MDTRAVPATLRAYLCSTALLACIVCAQAAPAQTVAGTQPVAPTPPASAAVEPQGLEEIVVTAQRREQRLQDVPVAVTALSAETLQANRVTSVADLSGLAPNVLVRPAAGGTNIPSFSIRGIVSYGVVAGSDKQVSIYVDGVYLSNPRGSIFDLPDIERIEVLRGPQGTLFGRNATAGAVSVVTRNPTGKLALRQDVSIGNYDQLRTRTSVDLPAWGPLSAYVSYVHNERRGDIRNLGAGTVWDRSGPQTGLGRQTSPRYLGNRNSENVFAALRFEPSDAFDTVYKFSRSNERGSPEGSAFIGYSPDGVIGSFLGALITSQPTPVLVTDGDRPRTVNNSWTSNNFTRVTGHTLTSTLQVADGVTATNIAAYRRSFVSSSAQIDGLGGLVLTPAAVATAFGARLASLVGQPFQVFNSTNQSKSRQWSDELQLSYASSLVSMTAGGLYFHSSDRGGGPVNLANSLSFTPIPNFLVPIGNESVSYNKATSIAAYARTEIHVTSTIDLVGGARVTHDNKTGDYRRGGVFTPATPGDRTQGTITGVASFPFTYRKTLPNYEVGVNYKPDRNLLAYVKYATAFVSGGSVASITFEPEKAGSLEGGIKADLLDRRLRTNLSVFSAKYRHVQSAQGGSAVGRPELAAIIIELGTAEAKGFEFEATALPVTGLTLGGSFGFTDIRFRNVNPILVRSAGGTRFLPTLIPRWTYMLSAQYETEPLFDDARATFRVDANGRSRQRLDPNPDNTIPYADIIRFSPAAVIVNARAALGGITLGGVTGEVAAWGRNLNNNRAIAFPLGFGNLIAAATFQQARTYGLDFSVKF